MHFLQLEKGDLIAVTKGNTSVEEFAIVTRGYYYKPDPKYIIERKNSPNAHRADVEYLGFGTDEIGSLGVAGISRDAQGKIAGYLSQKINGSNGSTDPMSTTGTDGYAKTLEDDLNLLFYGPPGTGKTFVAEKLATMPGVISTATHFILKPYKEFGIMMAGEYSDEKLAVAP